MLDINAFITEENRAGVRKLLEKYTDFAEDAKDIADDNVDYIIQIVTADAVQTDLKATDLEECLAALAEDPEDEKENSALVNILRYVKLVYFDKTDKEGTLFPLLQEDPDNEEELALPVFTRRKNVLNPEFKTLSLHYALYADIADMMADSGCSDIVINPDTDGFLFSIDEVMSDVGACMEISGMFRAIMTDGVEGEDLFPLVCACLDSTNVICSLKDGTQISGMLVLPRTEISDVEAAAVPDADCFTIIKDIEAEDEDRDLEEVIVLKADVSSISQVPDEGPDEDDEDGYEEDPELS